MREKAPLLRDIPREEVVPQVGQDPTQNIGKDLQDLKSVITFKSMRQSEARILVFLATYLKIQKRNVLKASKIVTTCIAM